ncbi:MAG: hypothetical protein ABL997_18125 [Planctomycetota bacterium]
MRILVDPRSLLLAACALATACALPAQAEWQRAPVMWPRSFHALANDPVTGDVRVFGGKQANTEYAASWTYAADSWSYGGAMPIGGEMNVVHDPVRDQFLATRGGGPFLSWDRTTWAYRPNPPTALVGARWLPVFDPVRLTTTLVVSAPSQTEVFEWDGVGWNIRSMAAFSPPWNVNGRVVHEPATGAILSLTSFPPGTPLQIWAFDGTSWQLRTTATQPPPLEWFATARDPLTSDLLVFGGYESVSGTAIARDQTWAYDGVDWRLVSTPTRPAARYAHAMTNDATNGRVLLHGGHTVSPGGESYFGDVWSWNGIAWSQVAEQQAPLLSQAPPSSFRAEVAFDRRLQQIVSWPADDVGSTQTFDGSTWRSWPCAGSCPQMPCYLTTFEALGMPVAVAQNGVMLFDGVTWLTVAGAQSGPPIMPTSAAIADDGSRLILFGGSVNGVPTNATWAFDQSGWTRIFPSVEPPPMVGHRMAGVPNRGGAMLVSDTQTWWWDGTTWNFNGPAPIVGRADFALVYHPERDRIVLHGGRDTHIPGTPLRSNVFEWDDTGWHLLSVPLSPTRAGHRLVEGPHQRLWAMPDAGTELFSYSSVHEASALGFGTGCVGTNGVPELTASPWQRPHVGDTFSVQVDSARPGVSILAIGFRDDQWAGQALPLALDPAGMTGCVAWIEPESSLPVFHTTSRATWSLSVPNAPEMLDLVFFLQAIGIDDGANPAGLTTSNALRLGIGQR